MIIRKSLSVLLILTIGAFGGMNLFAQTKQEKKAAKIEEKLKKLGTGEKATVKVKLYNSTTYQGYLSEANDDEFVVIDKGGNANRLRYSDVDTIGGKNLSTGAKIGIGIGIGLVVVIAIIGHKIRNADFNLSN